MKKYPACGEWRRRGTYLCGLLLSLCNRRRFLEYDAVGEHEVGDAAVEAIGHATGIVLVEEVV